MNVIHENGNAVFVFEGREPNGDPANYAILKNKVTPVLELGITTEFVHLLKIVEPALPTCMRMFQGIMRPCLANEDMDGGSKKRILILEAHHDFVWPEDRRHLGCQGIIELEKPPGMVYLAFVTPNSQKDFYPSVQYWLEHWTWVAADPSAPTFPIDYKTRFEKQL